MPEIIIFLPNISYYSDAISHVLGHLPHLPIDANVLAQSVTDPDILGRIQRAWANFYKTGQFWAMVIGIVIGWMLRNLTSYG